MLSENALTLLKKRYFLPDETWEKLIYRVVSTLNPNRKVQEEYAQLLFNCDFLPNTPTLINAGARTGQLMACFVLPVEDDIQAIFDAIKYAAMIHKSGGGTGFSFSNLREAGAMVNSTNGISSGPVSFMRVFNEATGAIKQGGVRRGANMGMLRIDHPDIREFIACKRDQSQFTNFNISVAITNEFMQAVIEDKEYPLISPLGTITGHEKATDIINLIGQCAHESGEPGLVFIDRINEMRSHLEMMDATNPCFSGEMELLTERGYVAFNHLRTKERVVGSNGIIYEATTQKTGIKECIELILSTHEKIVCTPDHVLLANGWATKAQDTLNKRLNYYANSLSHAANDKYLAYGFAQGDGDLTRLNSKRHSGIGINIGANDTDILKKVTSFSTLIGTGRKRYWPNVKDELIQEGFSSKTLPERVFPKRYYRNWTFSEQRAFLCGCFSANGCVIKNTRVAYKTTSLGFAKQLVWALKAFNIDAYITSNKPKTVKFPNGEYLCKQSYDINISRYKSLVLFANLIGFLQNYKIRALAQLLTIRAPKVIAINYLKDPIDVYDFSMEEHNWGIVNGIIAHNCGEQPLLPYEACVLGSINLANMLDTDNKIDFKKLEKTTVLATLMLNDIINVSRYPLPQIEKMVKRYRKIGLGVMGWADMLSQMKASYKPKDDESNSLEIAASVMSYISGVAKQTSGHLSEHFKIKLGIEENQANSTLTTIAPTGSISIIADCSSGIEPYYSLAYTKNVMDGEKLEYFNPYLQKDLEEAGIWNPKIAKAIMKHGSIQAIAEIPDDIKERYLTAEELDWKDHLSMQNAFQAFTDNAVSKTINLAKEVTVEDIIKIYKAAFLDYQFIKGLTVYRNGSRSGQVLVTGKKELCPECNGKVEHNEGCTSCPSCGWAACEE